MWGMSMVALKIYLTYSSDILPCFNDAEGGETGLFDLCDPSALVGYLTIGTFAPPKSPRAEGEIAMKAKVFTLRRPAISLWTCVGHSRHKFGPGKASQFGHNNP